MARHSRRRKFRRYLKARVSVQNALGVLAPLDVISVTEAGNLTEPAWLSSIKATWNMIGFTPDNVDGPIYVGVAHSDYSPAEIEEWIENATSWEIGDQIAQEVGKRKIRQVGIFESTPIPAQSVSLNDGKPINTKCGWLLTEGQSMKAWAYNAGSSAIAIGTVITTLGHANLWPTA